MEALPRFEHVFHLFSRSMRLPAGRNQIVFLDDKAPLQMQMLRQDIGPEGKIIVCCDKPGSIPADDLACVDDVWPSATLGELAEFRFRRLQERLKAEKDAWLTETYLEQTINTLPPRAARFQALLVRWMRTATTLFPVIIWTAAETAGSFYLHLLFGKRSVIVLKRL